MTTLADLERVAVEVSARLDDQGKHGGSVVVSPVRAAHWADTIAAYVAAQREREWQPIETAPKDTDYADLWMRAGFRVTNAWKRDGSWYYENALGRSAPADATHWMPLPKEPKP